MKKLITLTVLMLGFLGFGQCRKMIVKNDDISGTTKIKSDDFIYKDLIVKVEAGTTKGSYPKIIFEIKKGCVIERNRIIFRFSDGETLNTYNTIYAFNCAGKSGIIINSEKYRKPLTSKVVNLIRVNKDDTNENFYEVELTPEEGRELLETIQCAVNRNWEGEIKYKNAEW